MVTTIGKRHEFIVGHEGVGAHSDVTIRLGEEGDVEIRQGDALVLMHPEHALAMYRSLGEFLQLLDGGQG